MVPEYPSGYFADLYLRPQGYTKWEAIESDYATELSAYRKARRDHAASVKGCRPDSVIADKWSRVCRAAVKLAEVIDTAKGGTDAK